MTIRNHLRGAAATFLAAVLAAAAPLVARAADPAGPEKHPEPTAPQQAEADKLVKEVFKDDYMKRGPEERKNLAAKLLQEGINTRSDPVSQFVLLREARDLAAQVNDTETAMKAIDEIAKAFRSDTVGMKLGVLTSLKTAAKTVDANAAAAELTMTFVDDALAAENFDAANKGLDLASSFATASKNMQLVALLSARKPEVRAQQTAALESKLAADTLKKNPKDGAANHAMGVYTCLFKNQWDQGLPLLSQSGDPAWATVAKADMANPVDATEMTRVADGWWDLSQRNAPLKNRLLARAEFWYNLILPNVDGLVKARIEKRVETIQATKPAGFVGAVSEDTRKRLPTPAEMQRFREAAMAAKVGNISKRIELERAARTLNSRLRENLADCSDGDFFARLKADVTVRKMVTDATGHVAMFSVYDGFRDFAQKAKTVDEFVARCAAFERFNAVEKVKDAAEFDSLMYNTISYYVTWAGAPLNSKPAKLRLYQQLKQKGVKAGVERFKQHVDTFG